MDRRDFIKLTAVTGTSAALASCGNPEHQLIRFVPDDDITPGIAEWKPSVCPVCSAGCGVNVRVMDADVETVRDGQRGVMRMNVAKKLEGLRDDPIGRNPDHVPPRSRHPADEARGATRQRPVHARELGCRDRGTGRQARRARR